MNTDINLTRLYWAMRAGMTFIWLWTAAVSWFIYPQAQSLDWLRRLGLTEHTYFFFASACLLDLMMGMACALFATRWLWQCQFMLVVFYSLAVAIKLPEFLIHPFGPVIKNIAVLACLAFLGLMEKR